MSARISPSDQIRALLFHARAATPFAATNGELCVSVPSNIDARRIFPLRSAEFRDWLTANYFTEFESAPSPSAFRAALHTLEARARYGDFPAQTIANRVSFEGDPFTPSKIVLDLANASGESVEMSHLGWRLTTNLQHCFREFTSTLPLPKPVEAEPGSNPLAQLADLFHLNGTNRVRVFTWLAAALRPVGPYPILVLTGPAASGKTVLARALRALVDPSTVPLRRLPARDRDLLRMAFQNWILAFDHVQRIPLRISQALSALSSGDALEIPRTDLQDPLVFQLARPIILIVPKDDTQPAWVAPHTLSSHTLQVECMRIPALRSEGAVWSAFEALQPAMVGAVCNAVATALRRVRDINIPNVRRFPDCAVWAAAAAPAFDLDEHSVAETFRDPASTWNGYDPVRAAIHVILDRDLVWTGEARLFLSELRTALPFASLPTTPKGLSQLLLRFPEVRVHRSRGPQGQRILSITKVGSVSETAVQDASVLFQED